MKKFVVLSLLGLLIAASGSTVYAQTLEWKVSGMVDTNYYYYRNIPMRNTTTLYGNNAANMPRTSATNVTQWNKEADYFNTRGRLKFDAVMGKEVSGTLFFEMDSTYWGDIGEGRENSGKWKADQADVEVKNMYIDFAMPYFGIPIPMTMRVGVQPVSIRPQFVATTDGAGITAGLKLDPVMILPSYYANIKSNVSDSQDCDLFGLEVKTPLDKLTVGAYGLFANMRTYPYNQATQTQSITDPSFKSKMFWFGAYSEGKIGPFNTLADVVMDYGTVKSFGADPAYRDVNYQGFATRLQVTYPWERFEFGLNGMYASGNDLNQTSNNGNPGTATANGSQSRRVESYVVPVGSEEASSFYPNGIGIFYGNPITGRAPDYEASTSNNLSRGGIGGTWYVRAHASYKVTPSYKVTLLGEYIGDTSKNGNTIGNARRSSGTLRDDGDIGWEVGLWNEIQIYKTLTFGLVGAWLFPGDAMEQWDPINEKNDKPKAPYFIGSILKYTW